MVCTINIQSTALLLSAKARAGGLASIWLNFRFFLRFVTILASVNVDQIMRELDVDCLQRNLTNLTFCDIESEDLSDTDPNFIKLFRLAQLMLEYVLHSQDFLTSEKDLLDQRAQHLAMVMKAPLLFFKLVYVRRKIKNSWRNVSS